MNDENGLAGDPRSTAMTKDTHPEKFGQPAEIDPEEMREPENHEADSHLDELDRLRGELDRVRESLDQASQERDIYQRLSTIAEGNELILHRKLAPYIEQEMTALRARNEALEESAKNSESGVRQ